eukprot:8275726-Heterocapsa_arctica.AAC.1
MNSGLKPEGPGSDSGGFGVLIILAGLAVHGSVPGVIVLRGLSVSSLLRRGVVVIVVTGHMLVASDSGVRVA